MTVCPVANPRFVSHHGFYGVLKRAFQIFNFSSWNLRALFSLFCLRSKDWYKQKRHYQLNGNWNWICFSSLISFLLHWIYSTLHFHTFLYLVPISHLRSPFYSFFHPDYKGLSSPNAGAAARPCSVYKFHPVPVSHPRGHRLLHLQGLVAGLHGESDAGPAGLSWCWLHHRAPFPHQYRDVPGHESQVNMLGLIKVIWLRKQSVLALRPVCLPHCSRLKYLNCFWIVSDVLFWYLSNRMTDCFYHGFMTFSCCTNKRLLFLVLGKLSF